MKRGAMCLAFLVLSVAGGSAIEAAAHRAPVRCPVAVRELSSEDDFETVSGLVGCLTDGGYLFEQLLRASDVEGFRALTHARKPGAQLYGLCGLEGLKAPDAGAVRQRLSASQTRTTISMGDELDEPRTLAELLNPTGSYATFDGACGNLLYPGVIGMETCDPPQRRWSCRPR